MGDSWAGYGRQCHLYPFVPFVSTGPQESDGYTVMVNWEVICPKSWRYPGRSLDGLFHGKSQSKIDDWGYPRWIAPNFFTMNHWSWSQACNHLNHLLVKSVFFLFCSKHISKH